MAGWALVVLSSFYPFFYFFRLNPWNVGGSFCTAWALPFAVQLTPPALDLPAGAMTARLRCNDRQPLAEFGTVGGCYLFLC